MDTDPDARPAPAATPAGSDPSGSKPPRPVPESDTVSSRTGFVTGSATPAAGAATTIVRAAPMPAPRAGAQPGASGGRAHVHAAPAAHHEEMRRGPSSLAGGLGLASFGLGLPQLLAPGLVAAVIGVDDTPGTRAVIRAVGVRELAAGAGISLADRPSAWLWARVAGDMMDLALLGGALAGRPSSRARVLGAMAAVAGVTALDVLAATKEQSAPELSAQSPPTGGTSADEEPGPFLGRTAITVRRPADEVYRFWKDFENLPRFMIHLESVSVGEAGRSHWVATGPAGRTVEWDAELTEDRPGELIAWRSLEGATVPNRGRVELRAAPGDRGTEIVVEIAYDPPAGAVGSLVAKLFGEEPLEQVKDDLRRLKQVLETGEVMRSDATPYGTDARALRHQLAAQPS